MASTITLYNPEDGNHDLVGDALDEELKRIERYTQLDPEDEYQLKVRFLMLIAKGHSVSKAVEAINSNRQAPLPRVTAGRFYSFKRTDPDFALDWKYAYNVATDALEDTAYQHAMDGNASLMMFLMKIRNPKRYNPIQRTQVEGKDGKDLVPGQIEFIPVRPLTYDKSRDEYSEVIDVTPEAA